MTVGYGSKLRRFVTEAKIRLHFHAVFLKVLYHQIIVVLIHRSRLGETLHAPPHLAGIRGVIFTLLGLLLTRILEMNLFWRIQILLW
jgi:hypothetical protein